MNVPFFPTKKQDGKQLHGPLHYLVVAFVGNCRKFPSKSFFVIQTFPRKSTNISWEIFIINSFFYILFGNPTRLIHSVEIPSFQEVM